MNKYKKNINKKELCLANLNKNTLNKNSIITNKSSSSTKETNHNKYH